MISVMRGLADRGASRKYTSISLKSQHMGDDMMNDLSPMCLAKLVCLKDEVRWWIWCM